VKNLRFLSALKSGCRVRVFIIPYLMGETGAGDVKLIAAVGGLLGQRCIHSFLLLRSWVAFML
jgi:Flp pilus assembly protein protease CpaA